MPDQIDLSRMQSVPVIGPNGFLRLHRYWREADGSMWDDIWKNTSSRETWQHALDGRLDRDLERLALKYLEPGAKVLEAGCGVGQVVLALRAKSFDCVGLDYASDTIKILNKEFPEVPFHQGDIRCLPYPPSSFDGYLSLGVIEHFTEGQELMLREAARVVKPGGLLVISVPALNGWRALKCRLNLYDSQGTEPFFEACFSLQELELLLRNSGFTPQEHFFRNTVMTFAQETIIRPLYRYLEDVRFLRGAVDRLLRLFLPRSLFGHMLMVVAKRNDDGAGNCSGKGQ